MILHAIGTVGDGEASERSDCVVVRAQHDERPVVSWIVLQAATVNCSDLIYYEHTHVPSEILVRSSAATRSPYRSQLHDTRPLL